MILIFALLFLTLEANSHRVIRVVVTSRFEKGLQYLETQMENLDVNATFNLVFAKGELIYLEKTYTQLRVKDKGKIDGYQNILDILINDIKQKYPDDYVVENLFDAEQWVSDGDYRFRLHLVSGPKSPKSVKEIYGISILNDEKCDEELYANDKSEDTRSCGISERCMDEMTNVKDKGNVAPMQRLIFLSTLRYLKCSENPSNSTAIVKKLCNLIYKQVLTLTSAGYNEKNAYYYMDKILLCGSYGFAEFYNDDIINSLMKQQQPDGSIGTEDGQVKNVLTAQYIAILSSVYHLKLAGTVN